MKLSRLFSSAKQRIAAGAIIALAVLFPVSASAASLVKIQAGTGVANASIKSPKWGTTVSASNGQVVDIQVVYNNTEAVGSGKNANNLRLKINIPNTVGTKQVITTKTSSDNSNTVNGSATVSLSQSDAYLRYIPGTATWKHATAPNGKMTATQKVSDAVVTSANGLRLENEKPCQAGSIQVQAQVVRRGMTVDKYVRLKGTTKWATSITAKPGDTVQYAIGYKNTSSAVEKNVIFRDQLPKGVSYLPGTTTIKDGGYPNGKKVNSDALTKNGFNAAAYAPGATAYVYFDAKIAPAAQLACGKNTLRNTASVTPEGMYPIYNVADVIVNRDCQAKPTPTPSPTPTTKPSTPSSTPAPSPAPTAKKPVFSCDMLTVTPGTDRTVTASVAYTDEGGAIYKSATFAWGDDTTPQPTTETTQTYQYTKAGTHTIVARVLFSVDGKDTYAPENPKCVKQVSITTETPTTTPTPTTPAPALAAAATPKELPDTGAGNVIGIFVGAVATGVVAYRLFLSRKLSR